MKTRNQIEAENLLKSLQVNLDVFNYLEEKMFDKGTSIEQAKTLVELQKRQYEAMVAKVKELLARIDTMGHLCGAVAPFHSNKVELKKEI